MQKQFKISQQSMEKIRLTELRQEIKDIMNEVLDERELKKKMEGPYDLPEDIVEKLL